VEDGILGVHFSEGVMQLSTYKIEYISLLIIQYIFSILPRWITLRIGALIGFILFKCKAYRKTVYGNMRYCGYWTEEEIAVIVPRLYRNMGRYISDFLRLSAVNPPYRAVGFDKFENACAENRGVIAILAHIGNWEILAQFFGKKVKELNVIAKPMKNSFVDNWLAAKRASTGVTTIYVQQALRKMIDVLVNKKGVIAILIDQHGGQHGTMVPFLGKDANTVRTVAGIVKKTKCAVTPTYSIMQNDGSYEIYVDVAPEIDTTGLSEDEIIYAYQKQHNEIISSWIQKYPEHYFGWFHKRFRNIIPYN